ncbi:MAG TPA: hypothetical protein VHC69_13300 [Polyangiaceae bacterium]|nr:hypothetical protein [Polyangiaceae bacterium]
MKHQFFSAFLVLASGLFAACGGKDHAPSLSDSVIGPPGGDAGPFGAGGHAGRQTDGGLGPSDAGGDAEPVGAGGTPEGGAAAAIAPTITITYSPAATDPNVGQVLMSDTNSVTVVCTVVGSSAPGAKGLDASSVTLEMLDATGASLTMPPAPGVQSQQHPNQFSSLFIDTSVPNGKVSFRCTAKDLSGVAGSATVSAFVDHGPKVTLDAPTNNQAVPLTTLGVDFDVDALPLVSKGDAQAAIDTVTLAIAGQNIDLSTAPDSSMPGHYHVAVNLADGTLFPMHLDGATPVVLIATDKRGATRTINSSIVVDSQAPTIMNLKPGNGAIIPGKQIVEFDVADSGSGVKRDSVVLTVNHDVHAFDTTSGSWTESMGHYTYVLYGTNVTDASVQLNVNVTAVDNAGNKNTNGASAIYYLDTTPPNVDLDPLPIRERKLSNGTEICSLPFDPVGVNSINDYDTKQDPDTQKITGFIQVRAICYDQGNEVPGGQPVVYYSGMDQSTPKLYVQGNAAAGMLVDSNMDGNCDDVDTSLPFEILYPVAPAGGSDFEPGGAISYADPKDSTKTDFFCHDGGDSGPPPKLCNAATYEDSTRIIQHAQAGAGNPEPVVYQLEDDDCRVSQLDLLSVNGVSNGWLCLAVRAKDNTGNIGVSRPIRVCLDDPRQPEPSCANSSETPPSCTRGCAPPPRFAFSLAPTGQSYLDTQ